MHVYEQSEADIERNGELSFSHIKSIIKLDAGLFYTCTPKKLSTEMEFIPDELDLTPIPITEIFPRFPSAFTLATNPYAIDCYIKRPSLIYYEDSTDCAAIHDLILKEAEVCKFLKDIPHPNVVQYRGCLVEDGMITGVCFQKYERTLVERVRESNKPLDIDVCFQRIEDAVGHLHRQQLVHNDIKPSNVMMDTHDNPVVIDFDSCQRVRTQLGLKAGTGEFSDTSATIASFENDFYGLGKVKDFILGIHKRTELGC